MEVRFYEPDGDLDIFYREAGSKDAPTLLAAALINFRFLAHAVLSTDDVVVAMKQS